MAETNEDHIQDSDIHPSSDSDILSILSDHSDISLSEDDDDVQVLESVLESGSATKHYGYTKEEDELLMKLKRQGYFVLWGI